MTGERLKACWHCGETEHLRIVSVGSMTDDMPDRPHQVRCRHLDCEDVSGPVAYGRGAAVAEWNTRSLPAAIDRVIAEVAAMPVTPDALVQACKPSSAYETYQEHLLKLLRALRAEHSATQPDQAPSPPRDTGDS